MRPRKTLPDGIRFGEDFTVLRVLGVGATATVYEAREEPLGRIVALKVLDRAEPEWHVRFLSEARTMASLRHPHLAQVHRFGTDSATGLPFLAMERYDGSLADRLTKSRTLPEAEAATLGLALADALFALHGHVPPLVHRDVKPSNVLLAADGRMALADFGLARKLAPDATALTAHDAGQPGTWLYAAPEQRAGRPPAPAADWYSLGVTLFRCLTGGFPGAGGELPRDVAAEVARAWRPLLRGLLREDPVLRLADPETIRAALRNVQRSCRRRASWRRWGLVAVSAGAVAIATVSIVIRAASRVRDTADPSVSAAGQADKGTRTGDAIDTSALFRSLAIRTAEQEAVRDERKDHERFRREAAERLIATNAVNWEAPALPQPLMMVRSWLQGKVDPSSAADGVLRIGSGEVLFSGDFPPDMADPPAVLLDGGTLLVAPSSDELTAWAGRLQAWNAVGIPLPKPKVPSIPGIFPARILVGSGGGTIDRLGPPFEGDLQSPEGTHQVPGATRGTLLIRAQGVTLP